MTALKSEKGGVGEGIEGPTLLRLDRRRQVYFPDAPHPFESHLSGEQRLLIDMA